MTRCALSLLGGMLAASQLPGLPSLALMLTWLTVGFVFLPFGRVPALAMLGAGWFALHAWWVLEDRLAPADDRRVVTAAFRIADFPRDRGRARVFIATTDRADLPPRIRLSWYDAPARPGIGEHWQFQVVLRSPRGLVNAGGFDYERWLFSRRIGATGYVKGSARRLAEPSRWQLAFWRAGLESRLAAILPQSPAGAVMIALATGSRHRLDDASREMFVITGTAHLMAISGLHVGLIAGLVYLALNRLPFGVGRDRASLLAFGAALLYGLIAGFGVPVRRALIMLAAVTIASRWRRPLAPAASLSLAIFAVLCLEPLEVLLPGFWLSFGAVTAILLVTLTRRSSVCPSSGVGRLRRSVGLQARLWLLLIPLTVLFFDRVAWASIPANLLAIPVFGLFVVPATLIGGLIATVSATASAWVLEPTHSVLSLLLDCLGWLGSLPVADWRPPSVGLTAMLCLAAAAGTLLLPQRLPGRWIPLWLLVPVVIRNPAMPPDGCFWGDVLDVGQGLAVLIRTPDHSMLYDTGPAYASGSDAGERVVVPVLRELGIDRLNLIVLSHADSDHAGGIDAVAEAVEVDRIIGGEPGELPGLGVEGCLRGERWTWEGIEFRVLWPPQAGDAGNDQSCVVEIRVGTQRMLLTGDIERPVERRLLALGDLEPATAVVIPHHGSSTSSGPELTRALRPALALVSAAHHNRWGFPRADVVARWQGVGARVLSTGDHGALQIRICGDSDGLELSSLRDTRRRLWSATAAAEDSGT